MFASTRANYILRNLPPDLADTFAQEHDNNVWDCLRACMETASSDPQAREIAELLFREGGFGLWSARRMFVAAYWASWVDSLSQIKARHPMIAEHLVPEMQKGPASISRSV